MSTSPLGPASRSTATDVFSAPAEPTSPSAERLPLQLRRRVGSVAAAAPRPRTVVRVRAKFTAEDDGRVRRYDFRARVYHPHFVQKPHFGISSSDLRLVATDSSATPALG